MAAVTTFIFILMGCDSSFMEYANRQQTSSHGISKFRNEPSCLDALNMDMLNLFHVHVYLIPGRDGDTETPKGGVRGVMPGVRDYGVG